MSVSNIDLTEMYQFIEGNQVWTVTSSDVNVIYFNTTYTPIAINRDEIESKPELSKASLTIRVGLDNEMGRRWMRTSVDARVSLTVFSKDVGTGDVIVSWKGRLASVRPGDKDIQLLFESIFTSLRRTGVRQKYQRTCQHALYGNGCKVDPNAYMQYGYITNITNGIIIALFEPILPSGYLTGGYMQDENGVKRFIRSHSSSIINISRPLDGLAVDDTVMLYPGCDRSTLTCKNRFNNLENNGSFPFIPLKNPFSLKSIV